MNLEISSPGTSGAPFEAIAPYYDQLMEGIPYIWWFQYVEALLDRFDFPVETVLDLCCGTGNLTMLYALSGYQAMGVDVSAGMIERAREKADKDGLPVQYFVQDAAELCLPHRFDLVVSLFDSLNNLISPSDLQQCFVRVRQHLNRWGLFIFDLNTAYAFEHKMFDQSNRRADIPVRYEWRGTYDKMTRLCTIHMDFWVTEGGKERHFVEVHRQRAYAEREVMQMLRLAGFNEIYNFNAYTFKPSTRRSDRVFFVALKTGEAEEWEDIAS
jgi:ubiquinone/menaquinone biosynthesis C-methylase UbiE